MISNEDAGQEKPISNDSKSLSPVEASPDRFKRIRELVRLISMAGLSFTILRVLEFLLPERIFNVDEFFVDKKKFADLPRVDDRERGVRWGSIDDLDAVAAIAPQADVRGWFDRGNEFVVAERDGTIVGYEFFHRNHGTLDEPLVYNARDKRPWFKMCYGPKDVHAVYSHVLPEYRGQGIVADIGYFAAEDYRNWGYINHFGAIDVSSRYARRAHVKRGSALLGSVLSLEIFGLTLVRTSRGWRVGRWTPERPLVLTESDVTPIPDA